ncbi:MAG TPA: pro-sigmaK processing inhibitor BofA family protein [Candidatus Norongarragalinales archaeon]|jgi:hypothetical protein|nr:pro-sigmaK processing inhibitor BofA family protein [Candidatus Norongarragalinales archaeon]
MVFDWVKGIIANTIVGLILFFLLNALGVKISYSALNIIIVAIFGLFGLGLLLLAKLMGYTV